VTNVPKVIHNPTKAQSEQLPNLQENRNEDQVLDAIALVQGRIRAEKS
jgi:hypothetical protein